MRCPPRRKVPQPRRDHRGPVPAGRVVDIVARTVGQKMAGSLGVPVIVENKAGAGGTLGAAFVAKAKPDGYTLLLGGAATQVFSAALYTEAAIRREEGLRRPSARSARAPWCWWSDRRCQPRMWRS